ncbi:MAG: phosphoesterase [Anaerolineales bacterium]|nr:phosphoesterase [Anaerolineae bacterium]PWB55047.1 MAG: phosphoesterase [Anaerolineales bacterium]
MPSAQAGSSATKAVNSTQAAGNGKIKTVFLIVMENHNWSDILNNQSAPYINGTLLPQASYAQQYFNPNGNHPSEPNYLWLEAGTSFGITKDGTPAKDSQKTTDHLVTYLDKAGVSWKSYQEGITGSTCPLKGSGLYAPKHNPMVFFTDVTGNNDPNSKYCIAHVRPFSELQTDMTNNTVAQYNFITPNLCDDMHNSDGCQTRDSVKNGDAWLSVQVPLIMSSKAYNDGGVIFITWDESENGKHPIGMIVLSPFAKGGGYTNSIHYTHSSTLRSVEEIFGVTPLLGDAANATDLRDLFKVFP